MTFCKVARELVRPCYQLQFRTFNIVPEDSKIGKAALKQDVEAARGFFCLRKASSYDKTAFGMILVQYTTMCLRPMVRMERLRSHADAPDVESVMLFARLLIDCGVDPADCNGDYG